MSKSGDPECVHNTVTIFRSIKYDEDHMDIIVSISSFGVHKIYSEG